MSHELEPRFKLSDVEVLDRQFCHQGFLQIEKLTLKCRRYEGGWSRVFYRELMLRHRGVGVLLYDPVQDKVLLAEQFRAGCLDDAQNGPWALELVAGMLDSEESAEQVAIREANEEAGITISHLIPVCEYYNSPGGSNERLSIYCAGFDADAGSGIFGLAEENEDIRTVILPRNAALAAIASGRINNAMSIIALQWLELNLQRVRSELQMGKG
jgi:ADP-ribose pyrophosphatase